MQQEIRFGLVPVHDDEATSAAVSRLVEGLGRALGVEAVAVTCADPEELARRFGEGELDLVWSSPTLALTELRDGVPLVASERQGVAYYHGVLFVRRDSDIRGPLDAKGRSVAWVAHTSAAGYLFPRIALASLGIEPDELFGEEQFLGSHGAVARAVIRGEAEVGATFAVFEEGDATRALLRAGFSEDPEQADVRILFCTPPIPSDLVVASKAALDEHGPFLREALLALPLKVPDALKQVLGADGFMACRPRFLEALRAQLEDARVLGVL